MGVPTSEVGYTSATTGRGDHEVHKGHVLALAKTLCIVINRGHYSTITTAKRFSAVKYRVIKKSLCT
jgi:hypothetical protein